MELEVPANGSAVATFYVTSDFDGELQVSLEDIPLRVEPTTIPITKSDDNREVELTFYGNESLGQQTFDGEVRFLALTGGNIASGIIIGAKVTNVVEEQQSRTFPNIAWYIYTIIVLVIALIVVSVIRFKRKRY